MMSWVCANEVAGDGLPMSLFDEGGKKSTEASRITVGVIRRSTQKRHRHNRIRIYSHVFVVATASLLHIPLQHPPHFCIQHTYPPSVDL